jgi:rare lipoprotein A
MRGLAVAVITLGTLAGCAVSPPPGDLDAPAGLASWYGPRHHGGLTASGEPFDMHELVAAHRTLPFGTQVRVINLDNGRTVVVRIVDRGPSVPGRVIDLSRAAAEALDMLDRGLARVRLQVLDTTPE